MKNKSALFLSVCAMLFCWAYGDIKTSNVSSLDDLNAVIEEMGNETETSRYLQLVGANRDAEKYGDVIRKSMWMDVAHHWNYRYWENPPKLIYNLELKEGMRLLAAMRDEKRVPKLQGPERMALKQMQKIVEKCQAAGATRQDKVMMVLDDLRHNSSLTAKQGAKKRKGSFAAFVLRKKGDEGTCAEYLQVMFSALGIPCHTNDAYWRSCTMVQLDNKKWYCIKQNLSGFEVINLPESQSDCPDFPPLAAECDVEIPTFASAKQFWEAAEKASAAGAEGIGAKVKKYPGSRAFREAYDQYVAGGGQVTVAEMYLPSEEGKTRFVCVSFAQEEEQTEPKENKNFPDLKPTLNAAKKKFKKLYGD